MKFLLDNLAFVKSPMVKYLEVIVSLINSSVAYEILSNKLLIENEGAPSARILMDSSSIP